MPINRDNWKDNVKEVNDERICELLRGGVSVRETADQVGCAGSTVYKVARRNGIKMRRWPLAENAVAIAELTRNGTPYGVIARKYGVDKNTVREFCKRHGIELTDEQKTINIENARNQNGGHNKLSDAEAKRRIEEKHSELEYISGYNDNMSQVTVLCKRCGKTHKSAYALLVRTTAHRCPNCSKMKKQASEAERIKNRLNKRKEQIRRLEAEEEKKRAKAHKCPVCGAMTTRRKYCSEKCANRVSNKQREVSRRMKLKMAMVDHDISLEGLYKRDQGICHICGMQTRFDDYVVRDGAYICGDWYPSIDHVIPISKGGTHSWTNVKLAHRRCNYMKADRYPATS